MKSKIVVSPLAENVFKSIEDAGGKVYIVGGTVRDYLLNNQNNHDIDVEVYHLSYDELKRVLGQFGNVNTYGKSFAIMSLDSLKGYDFALPRKESKTGVRHQDFDIIIDKDLSLNKAILRRDVTMNALMYDYFNNRIIDLCDGIKDIENKIIRMVNPDSFKEDPLRILRIAQFVARFDMIVEEETKKHCKKMIEEGMLEHLSIERIYEEYRKILMSNHPSLGFEFLKEIGALPKYLSDLIYCDQRRDFHPEGSVWNHTMLVLDIGALCKDMTDNPEAFMWSCLLHDIGKPSVTTDTGSAPGHNNSGVQVFKDVNLITSKKMRVYIETMIYYHMHLMNMAKYRSSDVKFLRLLKLIDGKISLSDLMYISICDKLGRGRLASDQYNDFLEYMNDKIDRLGNQAIEPIITGKDLIDAGFDNHSRYKELLDKAYDMQLQGMNKEKVISVLKKELKNDKR